MTLILGLLGADRDDNRRPSRVAENINDMLVRLGEYVEMPITCSLIYGVVDLPSGILLYVNAGHPHPIICNRADGKYHHLPPTTMLLGVQGGVLPESCHQFKQYDRLVLFTDGMTDMINKSYEPYGEERLLRNILKTVGDTPDEAAQRIFDDVDLFGGEMEVMDDETLVIIDFDNTIS